MNYKCRHCESNLKDVVIDLGHQPPSNAYLTCEKLSEKEVTFPMKVYVCRSCWLVQLPAHSKPEELFTPDYAYFSSTSESWCNHAELYVNKAQKKLNLDSDSFVIELASNDGYLLQYVKAKSIPCLGIEPAMEAANESRRKGIKTISEFFGVKLAKQLLNDSSGSGQSDLIIANNVLAHVPDINDFLKGINLLLKPSGYLSVEFPHLLKLIEESQFDTIYHEHFSYLSLRVLERIANFAGLFIEDVEELSTHGGSLRVWFRKIKPTKVTKQVKKVFDDEEKFQLEKLECYSDFQSKALSIKLNLMEVLLNAKKNNKVIYAYGAAAKGNTLLNYLGVKNDLIKAVVDKAPSKQGKFLPGSHIPIVDIKELKENSPDFIIVFPWNLMDEISKALKGYKLITAIPKVKFW